MILLEIQVQSLQEYATIPGSNTVGIELPNNIRENVYLSEILDNADFKKKEIKLPIALGKIFLVTISW
jgi:DNA segregation ATPase FtsK/SpoIIIE-like protein